MSEWFGEPPKELPRPDDAQRARLRKLAQEWQSETFSLEAEVKEFADKHNISLEEAPTEADSSADGIELEEEK